MANTTGIEWTDATWNPIRGCSRVSEGCRHCYAEGVAYRFSGPGQSYEGLVRIGADGARRPEWNGVIQFVEKHLLDPIRWKTPRRIFVNSMSDLFHEGVTDEMLDMIFAVMSLCPQHTFQTLTKRAQRQFSYWTAEGVWHRIKVAAESIARKLGLSVDWSAHRDGTWLDHIWTGVSVENQTQADARIPWLLRTPAAKRFLSCEPLLGIVNLASSLGGIRWIGGQRGHNGSHFGNGSPGCPRTLHHHHDDLCERGIDWVIAGGESGQKAGVRPMHPDWARGLRDQCVDAGVPFFFKQWGGYLPWDEHALAAGIDPASIRLGQRLMPDGTYPGDRKLNRAEMDDYQGRGVHMVRVGKKAAGDLLDGVQWHQFPEVSA